MHSWVQTDLAERKWFTAGNSLDRYAEKLHRTGRWKRSKPIWQQARLAKS